MLHEMLHSKGINWNDYSVREKRGGFVETQPSGHWGLSEIPILAKEQDYLLNMLPPLGYDK